ncbi:endonuclease domain-containing protein [Achromobacter xylosoxidans]
MKEPVHVAEDMPAFFDHLRMSQRYPLQQATWSTNLSEMFSRIRRAYRQFQVRVDAGLESWAGENQYAVGDWVLIFSPIEQEAWYHIRRAGLSMWPQLPVAGFFLDFGNPIAKVALECDGAQFHDARKDAARDRKLAALGWTVYRVPGWQCLRDVELPPGYDDMHQDDRQQVLHDARAKTILPVIDQLARHFPAKETI